MKTTTELISKNVKRLRKLKELSQKEVSASCSIPQAQYSRIENGKVEPSISSLEKIAGVFEVSLGEFFKSDSEEEQINLPLIEKIKLIDQLEEDEKNALLKMVDIAISKKRIKDNLSSMLEG